MDLDVHRLYKTLFTSHVPRFFRQRVENLCAEGVCFAPLCSLKTAGTREEEEGDRGLRERERRGEGREIKKGDSSHVFIICLFVLPRGPPSSSTPVSSPSSLAVWIFLPLSPSCICRLSRQHSLFHSRLMSQLKLMCSVCADKEERGRKKAFQEQWQLLACW